MGIKEKLPKIKKDVSLAEHTAFRIGGPARYFFTAENKKELTKAVLLSVKFNLPLLILGSGSNILIGDDGFDGLVIKNEARKIEVKGREIIAESGAVLDKVVETAVNSGLSGIEKGSGIPGTIGGAVYGNAGWSKGGWNIGEVLKEAEILTPTGEITRKKRDWFDFDYRYSKLKGIKGALILEVVLELERGEKEELKKKRKEVLEARKSRIPSNFSAGSIFKNFIPHRNKISGAGSKLSKELKKFQKTGVIPAGFLIEKCGLRGKRIGDAQISEKHANFIVNLGQAKAKDVKELIKLAKEKVKEKFDIELEEEIQIINN